jgi:hypothetical protein
MNQCASSTFGPGHIAAELGTWGQSGAGRTLAKIDDEAAI